MATIKNDECKQNSLNIYSVNNSQNKTFHLSVQIVMHAFSDSFRNSFDRIQLSPNIKNNFQNKYIDIS